MRRKVWSYRILLTSSVDLSIILSCWCLKKKINKHGKARSRDRFLASFFILFLLEILHLDLYIFIFILWFFFFFFVNRISVSKQCWHRSDNAFCGVWSGYAPLARSKSWQMMFTNLYIYSEYVLDNKFPVKNFCEQTVQTRSDIAYCGALSWSAPFAKVPNQKWFDVRRLFH